MFCNFYCTAPARRKKWKPWIAVTCGQAYPCTPYYTTLKTGRWRCSLLLPEYGSYWYFSVFGFLILPQFRENISMNCILIFCYCSQMMKMFAMSQLLIARTTLVIILVVLSGMFFNPFLIRITKKWICFDILF